MPMMFPSEMMSLRECFGANIASLREIRNDAEHNGMSPSGDASLKWPEFCDIMHYKGGEYVKENKLAELSMEFSVDIDTEKDRPLELQL